jgi:ABC-type polysaccharide/polyol phosphate transport system ATPase subunit
MDDLAVIVDNVSKTYRIRERSANTLKGIVYNFFRPKGALRDIKALKDISFTVKKGEAIGIIGSNGSGKTTLMNVILGAIKPDEGGKVQTNGKIIKLSLGLGFNMNMSARDNIFMNGSVLGLSIAEIKREFDSIIEFSGLHDFVDTPVKYYSKGMKARLTFAVAVKANADIWLLDEFFGGVGDDEFKEKSNNVFINKINEGKTLIMVSHGKSIIRKFCQRTVWIDKGIVKMVGDTSEVLSAYKEQTKRKMNAKNTSNDES